MVVRLAAGVALVAVALLGFTVAIPQDAQVGVKTSIEDFLPKGGQNIAGADQVDPGDVDLGDLLDRLDGATLDPDLAANLDPAALAKLLEGLSANELAALGYTPEEAQALIDRLRDPELTDEELAAIARDLADHGMAFANADADGRLDGGEEVYADLDRDGEVSEGDLRLGALLLLLGLDRALDDEARALMASYERAGAVGLNRPGSAATRATATAATTTLFVPGYPTDRAVGPLSTVCVPLHSPSLTCHTRTFVHGRVEDRGEHYLFLLDTTRTPVKADPTAPGLRASGPVRLDLQGAAWTPVPHLTPGDVLVGLDRADIELARDGNGMLWARGPQQQTSIVHLNLTWAVDLAYYDLPVAADVTPEDVPAASRPILEAQAAAVGLRIADLAGAQGRSYGDALRALQAYVRGFRVDAMPDRDESPDDLLAYAESQVGCARHRAEVFVLGAQALGMPARLVLNEGHAFAEAFIPKAGWHLVDVGACGLVQVKPTPGHVEVMAHQDLPYADGDAPPSNADGDAEPAPTTIDITEVPTTLRRNVDFTIAGFATAPGAAIPEGIPITFTYNQTKEKPGTPFCSTRTEEGGSYRATCRLGPGTPAGSLQLVARLAPSVVNGVPSRIAYSDPPLTVQKATTLSVVGPARTSADVASAYVVHVVDEDGAPVPHRPVTLAVDGGTPLQGTTDSTGRARFTLNLKPGAHRLAGNFAGDDVYDPSSAALEAAAGATRITAQVDGAALEDDRLVVSGTVATAQGAASGRRLTVQWSNDPDATGETVTVTTTSGGAFKAQFTGVPRPGPGLATVTDTSSGTGLAVAFHRVVPATATLTVPERYALGTAVPARVALTGPVDPVPLRILLDGLLVADVMAGGGQEGQALLTVPAGVHRVTVEAGAGVTMDPVGADVLMAPVETTLDPIPPQAPGGTLRVTGTVRFAGEPLATGLELRLLDALAQGASDTDGRFVLELDLPDGAPHGNHTAILAVTELGHQGEVPLRIQRAANLVVNAPKVSFLAFGSTGIVVRGEGDVTVRAGGEDLGDGGRVRVPTDTWLWRRVTVEATATPPEGVSPSTATATITVVNPLTVSVVPLAFGFGGWGAHRGVKELQRRRAFRNRFLPPRPRSPVRVVSPDLPRRVPLVFDPALDGQLVLRLPHKGAWRVLDAQGRRVPASVEGRLVTIALADLPFGRHELTFAEGRRQRRLAFSVQDLRSALDEHTLDLLKRIQRPGPWPALLEALEDGLRSKGAIPDDAVAVRREAEESLYTMDTFGRDRFHAYFAALDAAQSRRPGRPT